MESLGSAGRTNADGNLVSERLWNLTGPGLEAAAALLDRPVREGAAPPAAPHARARPDVSEQIVDAALAAHCTDLTEPRAVRGCQADYRLCTARWALIDPPPLGGEHRMLRPTLRPTRATRSRLASP